MPTPLTNPTFRRLFAAQVTALLGSGLTTIALALLAYDLAGADAGLVLGTALALKMIAAVTVAPIAGGLATRVPRRAFLITLDLARAGCVLCLPFVTQIWQIYVLIVVLNACSSSFTPVFQATIPDVLKDEDQYTRALSLSRLAYDLENLLSPALAAAALLVLSYDALFIGNALAFLISAVLIFSVVLPKPHAQATSSSLWQDATFGLRIYLSTPRLRGLLALSLAAAAAGAMVIVNTVVYVQHELGYPETSTALAFAASGAGSMAVALALPKLLERWDDRTFMLAGGVLVAFGLIAAAASPELAGLLAIWALLGAGGSFIQTPAGRLLIRSASESDRSLVYAAQFALSHACWLIAYPLAGWLVDRFSFALAALVLAGLALIGTLVAARVWPRTDPQTREHDHPPVEHDHLHSHDAHHQHPHEGSEGPTPHRHPHRHEAVQHSHPFVIDSHHPAWPD